MLRLTLILLAAPVLLTACVQSGLVAPAATAPEPVASASKVPWQVAPATALTAQVHRDEPQVVEIAGWGRVKATRRVLASFPSDLRSRPGRNRTVESCSAQLRRAAAAYGQATVETASLGPERRSRTGVYEGTVEVRIIYTRDGVHEVRQATMACYTRADGTLVDAKPLFPINDESTG